MAFHELFTEVSPAEAKSLLAAQDGAVLFIGKESCPYCQRFVPKLDQVATEKGWTVHYLNSAAKEGADEIRALRDHYQVPTVPGFLYAGKDEVKVRCDSSVTLEEIAAFVN